MEPVISDRPGSTDEPHPQPRNNHNNRLFGLCLYSSSILTLALLFRELLRTQDVLLVPAAAWRVCVELLGCVERPLGDKHSLSRLVYVTGVISAQ